MNAKSVDITVLKSDVYLRIRTHASYIASKDVYNVSKESYDRISIASDDSVMLDKLWDKTTPMLVNIFTRYIYGGDKVVKSSTGVTLHLTMPTTFNEESTLAALQDASTCFVVSEILYQWLDIANADEDADMERSKAESFMKEIRELIARRDMPIRGTVEYINVDTNNDGE